VKGESLLLVTTKMGGKTLAENSVSQKKPQDEDNGGNGEGIAGRGHFHYSKLRKIDC